MTKLEALIQLRDEVKSGDIDDVPDNIFRRAFVGGKLAQIAFDFSEAHEGSLDAAKALHEAVLPGWFVLLTQGPIGCGVAVTENMRAKNFEGEARTLARAWLLAILEALIAQEQSKGV